MVHVWGDNLGYPLGDGTPLDRRTPVAISDVDYDWKVSTPILGLVSGTYDQDRSVEVTTWTSGATIHYTRTGDEPTESDATVESGSMLTVSFSQTLKAKAFKTGMPASNTAAATYTMRVGDLFAIPGGATYTSPQSVTIVSNTPDPTIRYTTDGTTPTEASALYSGAITVATSTVLTAVGFKANWTSSTPMVSPYTMNFGTLAEPTAEPATGSYTTSVSVSLSAATGATIRYTLDGTSPNATSTVYTAPVTLDLTTTLKATAYHPDYSDSPELSRTYTIVLASPTLSPTGGTCELSDGSHGETED